MGQDLSSESSSSSRIPKKYAQSAQYYGYNSASANNVSYGQAQYSQHGSYGQAQYSTSGNGQYGQVQHPHGQPPPAFQQPPPPPPPASALYNPPPPPIYNSQASLPDELTLTTSATDARIFLVHPAGAPISSEPLFSILHQSESSPSLILHHGSASPNTQCGSVTFDSKKEFVIQHRGQVIQGKKSSLEDHTSIYTPMGKWKWGYDSNTLHGLELVDDSKIRVAEFDVPNKESKRLAKSLGIPKGEDSPKFIRILVPTDSVIVELICLSLVAVILKSNGKEEGGSGHKVVSGVLEVIGALAGG